MTKWHGERKSYQLNALQVGNIFLVRVIFFPTRFSFAAPALKDKIWFWKSDRHTVCNVLYIHIYICVCSVAPKPEKFFFFAEIQKMSHVITSVNHFIQGEGGEGGRGLGDILYPGALIFHI